MQAGYVRRCGGRKTQAGLALCLAAVAAITLATGSASAAPASNTQTVSVQSNEADLGGFKLQAPVVIPDPILPVPIVLTDLTVSAKATLERRSHHQARLGRRQGPAGSRPAGCAPRDADERDDALQVEALGGDRRDRLRARRRSTRTT